MVPLLHREGVAQLAEDGHIIIDVLQAGAALSPGTSGDPRAQPPHSQSERPPLPLAQGTDCVVSADSTAHFTEEGTALERKELAQVSHLGLRGLCFSSHTQSCLRPCSLEGQFCVPACVPACPSLAPTSRIYHVGTNTAVFPQTPWNPSFPSSPLPSCPSCPQLTLDIALCSGTCRAET